MSVCAIKKLQSENKFRTVEKFINKNMHKNRMTTTVKTHTKH